MGAGRWTGKLLSPVHPLCTPLRVVWGQVCPSGLPPAQHLMGTPGALASPVTKQAAPFGGMCAVPPFPCPQGTFWVQRVPIGRYPLASPLGQVWQQWPGSSVARGQVGTGQSCFMFLQFTFPTGFPRRFLCCRGWKSRGELCQAVPRCAPRHSPAPPIPAQLEPPQAAQTPCAAPSCLYGSQARVPPHGPQPPAQLCTAPPVPAWPRGAARREGGGRGPSPRKGRRNEA